MPALTLLEASSLSRDPAFRERVRAGLARASVAIHAEAVTDDASRQRVAFASRVARRPESFLDAFALAIAASLATETVDLDDATLYSNLAGVWDTLAVGEVG